MHRHRHRNIDPEAYPFDPYVQPEGTSHFIISLSIDKMCSSSTDEKEMSRQGRGDTGSTRSSANESRAIPGHSDFNDSSNDLWSLYAKKAESDDETTVGVIEKNMDASLIFVCSYSCARLRAWLC
jgi:hypothetical protein